MITEREKKKLATRLLSLIERICGVRDEESLNVSDTFQRLPLRTGTNYYKIVHNPLSLHTIKRKIKNYVYENSQEFVDDLALISWNARLYNDKESKIFKHALILKHFTVDVVIPKLKNDKALSNNSTISYPVMGKLPGDKNDHDNENLKFSEKDTFLEDFSKENTRNVMNDYYVPSNIISNYNQQTPENFVSSENDDILQPFLCDTELKNSIHQISSTTLKPVKPVDNVVRRGRPPIIDKPFETLIKSILKQFKKLREISNVSRHIVHNFEKLPDPRFNSEYYALIKNPISLNDIKIKVRTRKYLNLEMFINDLDILFSNLKILYEKHPDSQDYIDYVNFKRQVKEVVQLELNVEDKDSIISSSSNNGMIKFSLKFIETNGFTYGVGDWILVSNKNDPEKPIVSQIFRIWATEDQSKYVTVCWYYFPEQTCHTHDHLFFKNEVFKTGLYRDHLVNEIIGPCYVIFLSQYLKGDFPNRMIQPDVPWFICEFRYNETNHVFNAIKNWKSCLPDEIRNTINLPLVPLSEPRKLIKFESPLKNLLSLSANEKIETTDMLRENNKDGPPLIGSIYYKISDQNDDTENIMININIHHCPEYDDTINDRKAFLFFPDSHSVNNDIYLKENDINNFNTQHVNNNRFTNFSNIPGNEKNSHVSYSKFLNNCNTENNIDYNKLNQNQILENNPNCLPNKILNPFQPSQKFFPSQSPELSLSYNDTKYHTSVSIYSMSLGTGILSYSLIDKNSDLKKIDCNINKRTKVSDQEVNKEIVFYRTPPLNINGNRIITNDQSEFGYSARYLAWKIEKKTL